MKLFCDLHRDTDRDTDRDPDTLASYRGALAPKNYFPGWVGSYSDYKANLSSTATAVGITTGTELELSLATARLVRPDRET